VVITGMGMVSPLGRGTELAWRRLLSGASGLSRLPEDLAPDVPGQVAGQVPDLARDPEGGWDIDAVVSPKDQRKMDRFIPLALDASDQALAQAGWQPASEEERTRTACIIGSGIGGFGAIAQAVRTTDSRGVAPVALHRAVFPGQSRGRACVDTPWAQGPAGCAGHCLRSQRAGPGRRPAHDPFGRGRRGAVRRRRGGHRPREPGRVRGGQGPFHGIQRPARRGLTPLRRGPRRLCHGRGAGALVLEGLDHALARGAVLLAEVVGYGTSADAYHITSGPEDGDGARRSMAQALAMAGLSPDQLQYLNAHATSTPVGDRGELAAMRSLFGEGSGVAISSTKSATGHLLGAAGAVAAIFTVLALRDQMAPATRNLVEPDPLAQGLDLDRRRGQALGHGACPGQRFRLWWRQRLAGAPALAGLNEAGAWGRASGVALGAQIVLHLLQRRLQGGPMRSATQVASTSMMSRCSRRETMGL
jgi:3-oxoacyl-[acyl-carrier-protein] synthase II